MKLIVQIPCLNEEQTLGIVLEKLPRSVRGFDSVEWLIVNDGSTDGTLEVARAHGVDHIVDLGTNRGLAAAFIAGLDAGLKARADVIVNIDADNQYDASYIPRLVGPILESKADMVIGTRPISAVEDFSLFKKVLQRMGSWVVRIASGTTVPDAPSGFRAFNRDAALRMNVFGRYTYTLETIIQAGQTGIRVAAVDVGVNPELRPSRLVKSIPSYVYRSVLTIFRIFVLYKPFRFFASIGSILFLLAVVIGVRFLFFYFAGNGSGHVQSLILAAILAGAGSVSIMTAFLADLLAANRRLLEDLRFRARKREVASVHTGELSEGANE